MSDAADDLSTLGPAMAALTEKQRKFVWAMISDPYRSCADWAREAGYSDASEGCKVQGHANLHNPKIEAAVLEISRGTLGARGPALVAAGLIRAASDPKDRRHMQAVEMIANRVGMHEVKEMRVHRTDDTGEAMMKRIKQLGAKLGVDVASLLGANAVPKLIEVNPEPADGSKS